MEFKMRNRPNLLLTLFVLIHLVHISYSAPYEMRRKDAWTEENLPPKLRDKVPTPDKAVAELEQLRDRAKEETLTPSEPPKEAAETPESSSTTKQVITSPEEKLTFEKQLESLATPKIEIPFALPFPYIPRDDVTDVENPVTHAKSTTVTSRVHQSHPLPANLLPFDTGAHVETSTQHEHDTAAHKKTDDEEKATPKTYSGAARLTGCATCAVDQPSKEKVETEHEHEHEEVTPNGQKRINLEVKANPGTMFAQLGKQYSANDLAQYIFWTGDEAGVARAIEELIDQGVISRESALALLKEIRLEIEMLQDTFTKDDLMKPIYQEPLEYKSIEKPQATLKTLATLPRLLKMNEIEGSTKKEIEYDDTTGRLRVADFLYAEYSLEEVIYQLAKVMFANSLTQGSEESQIALQRLTTFLENEGAYGRISPALQKKILDVLLAALSDTLNENPELMSAAKKALGSYLNKLPKHSQYKN